MWTGLALAQLAAPRLGAGLARALAEHGAAARVYRRPHTGQLARVRPEQ